MGNIEARNYVFGFTLQPGVIAPCQSCVESTSTLNFILFLDLQSTKIFNMKDIPKIALFYVNRVHSKVLKFE